MELRLLFGFSVTNILQRIYIFVHTHFSRTDIKKNILRSCHCDSNYQHLPPPLPCQSRLPCQFSHALANHRCNNWKKKKVMSTWCAKIVLIYFALISKVIEDLFVYCLWCFICWWFFDMVPNIFINRTVSEPPLLQSWWLKYWNIFILVGKVPTPSLSSLAPPLSPLALGPTSMGGSN